MKSIIPLFKSSCQTQRFHINLTFLQNSDFFSSQFDHLQFDWTVVTISYFNRFNGLPQVYLYYLVGKFLCAQYSIIGAAKLAPEKVIGAVLVGQVRKGGSRVSCLWGSQY